MFHVQVGDNPAADVRGANRAGPPWVSVLVRTGVFNGPPGSNSEEDPAQVTETILCRFGVTFTLGGTPAAQIGGDQVNGLVQTPHWPSSAHGMEATQRTATRRHEAAMSW